MASDPGTPNIKCMKRNGLVWDLNPGHLGLHSNTLPTTPPRCAVSWWLKLLPFTSSALCYRLSLQVRQQIILKELRLCPSSQFSAHVVSMGKRWTAIIISDFEKTPLLNRILNQWPKDLCYMFTVPTTYMFTALPAELLYREWAGWWRDINEPLYYQTCYLYWNACTI